MALTAMSEFLKTLLVVGVAGSILGIPGFALMFIRCGYAKIKPDEVYTIYF